MSFFRISYVNGRYVRHAEASIHIEDRGYQFSDGVYEVIQIKQGKFIDLEPHIKRLSRSLDTLEIKKDISDKALETILYELLRRNSVDNGTVYIQMTRGVAPRDHKFPSKKIRASIVITIQHMNFPPESEYERGVSVITYPDIRWGRRDVKSVSLLLNILAKEAAAKAKVKEAWLVKEDGTVTEGSSSNSFIVKDGVIYTHKADYSILGGITRAIILELAKDNGINFKEESFSLEDAKNADEAFASSTTMNVMPVTEIDGKKIGGGKVGEVTKKLVELYKKHVEEELSK